MAQVLAVKRANKAQAKEENAKWLQYKDKVEAHNQAVKKVKVRCITYF